MNTRLSKIAAAAVIILTISFLSWLGLRNDINGTTRSITGFSLLAEACAAEQALFVSQNVVHIINEITVYPVTKDVSSSDRLGQLNLSHQQRDYIKTVNSWLDYNWLPLCSLQADGQFRFNQLKLSTNIDQPYTIVDQAWYDPATGRFARVMKTAEKVIFANSYDGESIYWSETASDGSLQLAKKPITANFRSPQNPAEFLGLTAGFRSSIREDDSQPIQEITEDTLDDGSAVHIYKVGFADLLGNVNTYWLFKVRNDDSTIAEMEFVLAGQTQMVISRVVSESVDRPQVSWNLAEIQSGDYDTRQSPQIAISSDMVIVDVSVKHMVEKADYETYIFATDPPWAGQRQIVDCLDLPSPPHRMFSIVYRADDGRDVVLVQAYTYNKTFGKVFQKGQLIYTSPNGFKVWAGGPEKWWTKILLTSADLMPADDRSGYGLESPAGTFPALAINGKVTEEELHNLVDSFVPARNTLKDH